MKGFCKEVGENHKVKVDFSSEGVPSGVPPEVELCLFRVMQEGLHNALKHSGVRLFEVKLHGSPMEIRRMRTIPRRMRLASPGNGDGRKI
jgi:signal transduction histidine kinase